PEGGNRVVRRDQYMRGALAFEAARVGRDAKVGRNTIQGRVALGLDAQVVDYLVTLLDTVFHEEAVTHGVVGDVVGNQQVVGAVDGHAAVVGIVDCRVLDVLAGDIAIDMPVDRV